MASSYKIHQNNYFLMSSTQNLSVRDLPQVKTESSQEQSQLPALEFIPLDSRVDSFLASIAREQNELAKRQNELAKEQWHKRQYPNRQYIRTKDVYRPPSEVSVDINRRYFKRQREPEPEKEIEVVSQKIRRTTNSSEKPNQSIGQMLEEFEKKLHGNKLKELEAEVLRLRLEKQSMIPKCKICGIQLGTNYGHPFCLDCFQEKTNVDGQNFGGKKCENNGCSNYVTRTTMRVCQKCYTIGLKN